LCLLRNMPRSKEAILKDGQKTRFSKKRQPKPEKKSAGWKRKRTLKELLNICLTGEDTNSIKLRESLAMILGMKPEELKGMTFEEAMDLRQIQRAMNDSKAWKSLKETVYGQKHSIEGEMNLTIEVGYGKPKD